jgi:hypothetical protein
MAPTSVKVVKKSTLMYRIVKLMATLKIIPVTKQNFSQYTPLSFASSLAFVSWFLVPFILLVLAEWRVTEELSSFPDLKKGYYEDFSYYLTFINMGIALLVGPHLVGFLMRRFGTSLNLELLPSPQRQWMIWLSFPTVMLAIIIDNINFSMQLQGNPGVSWEVATVFCTLPNMVFALMSLLVQTGMLLTSSSVLALLTKMFEDLKHPEAEHHHIWAVCETYDELSKLLSSMYLLFFTTSSSSIMMNSFLLYTGWGYVPSCLFCSSLIVSGSLVLTNVAFQAEDFHETINNLILYFRSAKCY